MPQRLHELHPILVHFPLALLPTALVFDAIGHATNTQALVSTGRSLMPAAAVSAIAAGTAGLMAQEAVHVPRNAHDLLVTHRNLNAALIALTTTLALVRLKQRHPSLSYLFAGFAAVAGMSYTAYLGGKMVYSAGVGADAAAGVDSAKSPEIRVRNIRTVTRTATSNVVEAVKHGARHVARGEIAPAMR
jgi:uncharacterized membrane protein